MKKTLLTVIGLLMLTALLSPKLIGMSIATNSDRFIAENLAPGLGAQLSVKDNALVQGWFSSQGEMTLNYLIPGTEPFSFDLRYQVSHGPLVKSTDGWHIALAQMQITPVLEAELFPPDFLIKTGLTATAQALIGFDQATTLTFQISPANYEDVDGSINFGGLTIAAAISAAGASDFAMDMGEIEVATSIQPDAPAMNFVLGETQAHAHFENLNTVEAPSNGEFSLAFLRIDAPIEVNAEGFSMSFTNLFDDTTEALTVKQNFSLREMSGDLPLTRFQFDSNYLQVSKELLDWYMEAANDPELLDSLASDASSEVGDAAKREMAELFLNKPMGVEFAVDAATYSGEVQASLRLDWLGRPDVNLEQAQYLIETMNVPELLDSFEFELHAEADKALVVNSPASDFVQAFANEGMILAANGKFSVSASLLKGVLLLNGEENPLERFF